MLVTTRNINLMPFQSAYRKLHSMVTALLKIVNDMFEAVDLGRTTILVALDLSRAFDIIDHPAEQTRKLFRRNRPGAESD